MQIAESLAWHKQLPLSRAGSLPFSDERTLEYVSQILVPEKTHSNA
jgi:hypothetical protein